MALQQLGRLNRVEHGLQRASALALAQRIAPDVPFILVTGSLDEETAVAYLKNGATDYILKDRVVRLGPAVLEATERGRQRRARCFPGWRPGPAEVRFLQTASDDFKRQPPRARAARVNRFALIAVICWNPQGFQATGRPSAPSPTLSKELL